MAGEEDGQVNAAVELVVPSTRSSTLMDSLRVGDKIHVLQRLWQSSTKSLVEARAVGKRSEHPEANPADNNNEQIIVRRVL